MYLLIVVITNEPQRMQTWFLSYHSFHASASGAGSCTCPISKGTKLELGDESVPQLSMGTALTDCILRHQSYTAKNLGESIQQFKNVFTDVSRAQNVTNNVFSCVFTCTQKAFHLFCLSMLIFNSTWISHEQLHSHLKMHKVLSCPIFNPSII